MYPTNDDLIGKSQRTGLLTCVGAGRMPNGLKQPRSYLNAACSCGRIIRISRSNFLGEKVRSCGICVRPNYNAPRSNAPDTMRFVDSRINK